MRKLPLQPRLFIFQQPVDFPLAYAPFGVPEAHHEIEDYAVLICNLSPQIPTATFLFFLVARLGRNAVMLAIARAGWEKEGVNFQHDISGLPP